MYIYIRNMTRTNSYLISYSIKYNKMVITQNLYWTKMFGLWIILYYIYIYTHVIIDGRFRITWVVCGWFWVTRVVCLVSAGGRVSRVRSIVIRWWRVVTAAMVTDCSVMITDSRRTAVVSGRAVSQVMTASHVQDESSECTLRTIR